jgi:predicted transcriptional regulator
MDFKIPKNIPYYLRKMSSKDKEYLLRGRKEGRYKITQKGIEYIYNNIPVKNF